MLNPITPKQRKELRRQVKRGAQELDRRFPDGWADKIKLDELALSSASNCVLGQLSQVIAPSSGADFTDCLNAHHFEDGCVLAGHKELKFANISDAARHGLTLDPDVNPWLNDDRYVRPFVWGVLNVAWGTEILKRRQAMR